MPAVSGDLRATNCLAWYWIIYESVVIGAKNNIPPHSEGNFGLLAWSQRRYGNQRPRHCHPWRQVRPREEFESCVCWPRVGTSVAYWPRLGEIWNTKFRLISYYRKSTKAKDVFLGLRHWRIRLLWHKFHQESIEFDYCIHSIQLLGVPT